MKFLAIALATMATTVFAAPNAGGEWECKPATYQCAGSEAWDVCNTEGKWVYAGSCPPKTVCKFLEVNGSPYCVPPNYNIQ